MSEEQNTNSSEEAEVIMKQLKEEGVVPGRDLEQAIRDVRQSIGR